VIDDPDPGIQDRAGELGRIVFCTGKVYYDLLAEATKRGERHSAIVRIEGLYSFPEDALRVVLARYPKAREVYWAQEEPRNMGAWAYIAPRLQALLPEEVTLGYAGRPDRASPAEGYPAAHASEQARIVAEALG
jgi:2-oxoglutarate dehydrogenase E1 component